MKNMTKTNWITEILNALVFVLETLLLSSASPQVHAQGAGDGNDKDEIRTDHDEGKHVVVKAALNFFELQDSEDTTELRNAAKKKFRKLSLLHHPDRNENSEDSVQAMQKVNHHYGVLNDELDRREGIVHDNDEEEDVEDAESHQEEQTKEDFTPNSKKRKKRGRHNCSRQNKHSKKKPSKAARKREAERRRRERQAEKEMEEEWREIQRQRKNLYFAKREWAEKARNIANRHRLDTAAGRKQANKKFEEDMNRFRATEQADGSENVRREESMQDIDDDEHEHANSNVQPSSNEPLTTPATVETKEKPVNLVMECCMDDVVVALRMDLEDMAMATIQDELNATIKDNMNELFVANLRDQGRLPTESDVFNAYKEATEEYFQIPLDEDGNTILHYAVYYESLDVIGMIYHYACKINALPDIFLQENHFGRIPLDFCKCCVKDTTTLPQRMQSLTGAARASQPSLQKTGRRLMNVFRHLDWVTAVNAAASIGVGAGLFGVRLVTALIMTTIHLGASYDFPSNKRAAGIFSWHATWWAYRPLLLTTLPRWIVYCFVLPALSLFVFCSGPALLLLLVGVLPRVLISILSAMSAWIPIPAPVEKLRLGDLQFYILFAIATVALPKLVFWEVQLDEAEIPRSESKS